MNAKHLLILVCLSAFLSQGFPQSSKIDSLKYNISVLPANTEKVDNLLLLAQEFYISHPDFDSALKYGNSAYLLADILNYSEAKADALYLFVGIYYFKGKADSSNMILQDYIKLCHALDDDLRLAKGYYYQGIIFSEYDQYDSALKYNNLSIGLLRAMGDTIKLFANYNLMANTYKSKGDYESAAIYYHKSIDILELKNDELNLGILFYNLAEVYLNMEQYTNATRYANMGLELLKKSNQTLQIANCLTLLGRISAAQNNLSTALEKYNQAELFYIEAGRPDGVYDLYNNYGDVYLQQERYDMAIQFIDEALKGYIEADFVRGIVIALKNKGIVYQKQGYSEKALILFDSCYNLSSEAGIVDVEIDVLFNISEAYDSLQNHAKAYSYLKQHKNLADSIYRIETTARISELNLKYEKEKNEAKILSLDLNLKKSEYQRNAFLFTAAGIISLAIFILLYFRQKAAKEKIIAEHIILKLEEEKKLMAAKSLVEGQEEERKRIARELHDGLGVLLSTTKMHFSALKIASPENKPLFDKATQLLDQASTDVRRISHNMMPGLLTKLGLYEAVEDLFENLADNQELSVICNITGEQERLPENKEIMLYRVIQEMVNNTLKYAQAKNLEMQIQILPSKLDISYSDDGIGFDVEEKIESQSIGLKSIQSRINFLNGTVQIDSKPGNGVKYDIMIPTS